MFENRPKGLIQHCERSELNFHQICQKWSILPICWKTEAFSQTVLPDRSVLRRQKWWKMLKQKYSIDIFGWFSYSVKPPKEFASTIKKVGHDFPIFLFLHFKASAGTHRARDYGNWSFSLLTWALDLWADERHKALITFVIRNADAFKARETKGEFKIAISQNLRISSCCDCVQCRDLWP